MNLITNLARAYVYSGDWIADCPRPCGNAEHLYDRQRPSDPSSPRTIRKATFLCSNCKHLADIEWPTDMDGLMSVLQRRPVPQNRNWYPLDHTVAVRAGCEHGQSIKDLEDENAKYGVI